MNILEEIIKHKEKEIRLAKTLFPEKEFLKKEYFSRQCFSLKKTLNDQSKTGIIFFHKYFPH